MNCSHLTGLRRQICQGRIEFPGGKVKKLTKNEQDRFQAHFNGEPIPDRIKRTLPVGHYPHPPLGSPSVAFQSYDGPGTELKSLLQSFGIDPSPKCDCKHRAQEMDENGLAWSRQNRDKIIKMMVGKYRERLTENGSLLRLLPHGLVDRTAAIGAGALFDEACRRYLSRVLDQHDAMSFSVGVTTAPRDGEHLLPRCIDSIKAAGFSDPIVFAEPDSGDGVDCRVIRNAERLGAWRNWMASVRWLLENTTADNLILVQDDCVFSTGVREFLECSLWPSYDCGAIQLCCSAGYKSQRPGINPMQGVGMLGAWATVMHRFHAQQILEYGDQYGWRGHHSREEPNPVLKKAIDDFIGVAVRQIGFRCYIVRPSIVLHDAAVSSLKHGNSSGKGNNRTTLDWIGRQSRAINHVPVRKGPVRFQTLP